MGASLLRRCAAAAASATRWRVPTAAASCVPPRPGASLCRGARALHALSQAVEAVQLPPPEVARPPLGLLAPAQLLAHARRAHAQHPQPWSPGAGAVGLEQSSFCSASVRRFFAGPDAPAAGAAARGDSGGGGAAGNHCTDADWAAVVERLGAMAATKDKPNAPGGWRDAYEFMPIHMQRAGLTPERLSRLNFVHVAGTKGKGSTCAMVESVLRHCGYRTALYTSPHLVDVRERLRVDGKMIPRAEFAAAFWRVHGALSAAAQRDPGVGMPSFFSFITLLALDAILARPPELTPHVVVLEVGIGGRLDATNAIVAAPQLLAAAAVTSLGYDHMELLGHTLPQIAREKAGIMKAGRPVLVVPQPDDAMDALREVATRVGAALRVPPPLDAYSPHGAAAAVGLGGEHMRLNASLAVALAAEWEAQYAAAAAGGATAAAASAAGRPVPLAPGGPPPDSAAARAHAVQAQRALPAEYEAGLRSVRWPGRSQIVDDELAAQAGGRVTFYIDGAHTPESMATCAAWFVDEVQRRVAGAGAAGTSGRAQGATHMAALLFNCMRERDPGVLLPALARALAERAQQRGVRPGRPPLDAAIFSPMLSGGGVMLPAATSPAAPAPSSAAASAPPTDLSWQERMRGVWAALPGQEASAGSAGTAGLPPVSVAPSLPSALASLRAAAAAAGGAAHVHVHVLVTGSLYLVGDLLRLLGKPPL